MIALLALFKYLTMMYLWSMPVELCHKFIPFLFHSSIRAYIHLSCLFVTDVCVFKILLLLGYVLLYHICCFLICLFGVWVLVFVCFLFDGEVENFVSYQTVVDMTAEHPLNEILAIHRYHEIYTIPYRGTQWCLSSKCRKQTVWVEDYGH